MILSFPDTYSESTLPLPTNQLGAYADADIQALADKGYEVHAGLTPDLAKAIMSMAKEPAIREYCPKDAGERFANQSALKAWLSKKRGVFLLLKREDEQLHLAGYGWVGEGANPKIPGGETTFAIRIGELGQGQGLATPFARLMVMGSAGLYGAKNIWLETWQSNGGAVHVYHKIGFVDVAEEAGNRLTADGSRVDDTRLYMTFPNSDLLS